MSRYALGLFVSAVLCALPVTAFATTVVVPDDFPTIQQAIDSDAAVVQVRSGYYPERLLVSRSVVLEPVPWSTSPPYGGDRLFDSAPEIQSITLVPCEGRPRLSTIRDFTIRGFTVRGAATLQPTGGSDRCWGLVEFERCRLDSGLSQPGNGLSYDFDRLVMRGCTILGNARLSAGYVHFSHNTVIRGEVRVLSDGEHAINGNYWKDSPGTALTTSSVGGMHVLDNVVEGGVTGIRVGNGNFAHVFRNRVTGTSGSGFEADGSAQYEDNFAGACGGWGFDLGRDYGRNHYLKGNTVIACQSGGIRATSNDPHGSPDVLIEENVVGRCGGDGIRSQGTIRGNTVFSNVGSGIALTDGATVDHNIAHDNGRYGIEALTEATNLGCNDWFGNDSGAASGIDLAATDLSVDPLFCNLAADSVTLRQGSPLLDAPGCGLIGADSLGCADGTTETLEPGGPSPEPTGLALALYPPFPNPTGRGTRLSFTLPTAMRVRLTILDVQGREVARLMDGEMSAGAHETTWSGAPAGAYFVRLEAGDHRMVRRALVLR